MSKTRQRERIYINWRNGIIQFRLRTLDKKTDRQAVNVSIGGVEKVNVTISMMGSGGMVVL